MIAVPQYPPVALPLFPSPLLGNWLEGWVATQKGLNDWVGGAFAGKVDALDIPRWIETTWSRQPPAWTTPHKIVFETPIARLRDFSPSQSGGPVPTLVLPPQAGHDSCIVDYSGEQSQMGAILEAGLSRAASLDWIGATPDKAE